MYRDKAVSFKTLIGKTIINIQGMEKDSEEIVFTCSDGNRYKMYHDQNCCEGVSIEDVCGDFKCLIGSPVLMAEETSNSSEDAINNGPQNIWDDSFTWTFYNIATVKGYVTIRWYGSSNGYYSESVEFEYLSYEAGQSASMSAAAPVLRETMTIHVDGKPLAVYKDDIEKELYKHLGVGLMQFGG